MKTYKTSQEKFWAGKFGSQYIRRNIDAELKLGNVKFFRTLLKHAPGIKSVIEFGANVGLNLLAIKAIKPKLEFSAVEINTAAVKELRKIAGLRVYPCSILDFNIDYKRDLVLIKGVLIHINPQVLSQVYDLLYNSAGKYICIVEYYNPKPIAVPYRGHTDKLFKRDFAGEMMDRYGGLKLVDYGFLYRRENKYYDDLTWFLLKK